MSDSSHRSQFALLGQRRFAPFFWTQFPGAANDNLFKFAFTVMVTYQLQRELDAAGAWRGWRSARCSSCPSCCSRPPPAS